MALRFGSPSKPPKRDQCFFSPFFRCFRGKPAIPWLLRIAKPKLRTDRKFRRTNVVDRRGTTSPPEVEHFGSACVLFISFINFTTFSPTIFTAYRALHLIFRRKGTCSAQCTGILRRKRGDPGFRFRGGRWPGWGKRNLKLGKDEYLLGSEKVFLKSRRF